MSYYPSGMPNIDRVAKDIETTEGFAVRIRAKIPQTKYSHQKYSYERIVRGSFTVAVCRRSPIWGRAAGLASGFAFKDPCKLQLTVIRWMRAVGPRDK